VRRIDIGMPKVLFELRDDVLGERTIQRAYFGDAIASLEYVSSHPGSLAGAINQIARFRLAILNRVGVFAISTARAKDTFSQRARLELGERMSIALRTIVHIKNGRHTSSPFMAKTTRGVNPVFNAKAHRSVLCLEKQNRKALWKHFPVGRSVIFLAVRR
jgi:hypothetical protein